MISLFRYRVIRELQLTRLAKLAKRRRNAARDKAHEARFRRERDIDSGKVVWPARTQAERVESADRLQRKRELQGPRNNLRLRFFKDPATIKARQEYIAMLSRKHR